MDLGKDPDAGPEDYAEVIAASSSLSARILSSVNSSWFGVRQVITKVAQAVNLLGMVSVRMLALTHCLATVHDRVTLRDPYLKHYWQAGLIKAEAAKYYAEQIDPSVADEAFLVGLMQDMVLPMMHQLQPEAYEQVLDQGMVSVTELLDLEVDMFGVGHGGAGEVLGRSIGIPAALCEVIGVHHDQAALVALCSNRALAEATYFSSLFPHTCTEWSSSEALMVADIIEQKLTVAAEIDSIDAVLAEIGKRYHRLSSSIRPANSDRVDLAALVAAAAGEVAVTTSSLVGQVHSMMSSTTQVTSQLSAINAEAIRLQEQTQIDGLTGVLNRFGLEQVSATELKRLRDERRSLMLAFADLDAFKDVNDTHGHDKGDEALKLVASALQEVFGPAAMVGRYGGDEFVVLIGGVTDCEQANEIGRRVIEAIKPGIPADNGDKIAVGLSIGGIWCPLVPEVADFSKMLVVADELMYAVKADPDESVRIKAAVG